MAATVALGVPMPKQLPITGTWTLPFTAYLVLLSNRIVYHRLKNERYLGDRLASSTSTTEPPSSDRLYLASRAHVNFLENVPVGLLLAAVAELNGASRKKLHYVLATLFVARVLHCELGIYRYGKEGLGLGRPVGYYVTQGSLVGMAAWAAWCVRGYWGF
ncbi:hypothetical protein M501DRAFT_935369 [Patellaria atrata CBS 101060]|uniref:Membrane-associated proteins in eicosanoid and glutathione metabolism n=1 Tax=Patellaria atrata CBS 101060 TaxID=1346257 RepID=A0A9P4S9D5_9PEZI|nr:hypothetical protein M501DRAFT_935369 [Patellaria atrata CBS 101060]